MSAVPPRAPRRPPSGGSRLGWAGQTAAVLLLVWIALDGVDTLGVGVGFALLGAAVGAWLVPGEMYPWRPYRLVRFFAYFLRASLTGGIDVAWRALHPRMPIAPAIVEYPMGLPDGLPRAFMVGVISLLPGTLSVRLETDGRVQVHVLVPGAAQGLGELERRVADLFSLDAPGPERGAAG